MHYDIEQKVAWWRDALRTGTKTIEHYETWKRQQEPTLSLEEKVRFVWLWEDLIDCNPSLTGVPWDKWRVHPSNKNKAQVRKRRV